MLPESETGRLGAGSRFRNASPQRSTVCRVLNPRASIKPSRSPSYIHMLIELDRDLEPRMNRCRRPAHAVTRFARATGDLHSLSAVDIKLVALAYTLEVAAYGADHLRVLPQPPRAKARKRGSDAKRLPGCVISLFAVRNTRFAGKSANTDHLSDACRITLCSDSITCASWLFCFYVRLSCRTHGNVLDPTSGLGASSSEAVLLSKQLSSSAIIRKPDLAQFPCPSAKIFCAHSSNGAHVPLD